MYFVIITLMIAKTYNQIMNELTNPIRIAFPSFIQQSKTDIFVEEGKINGSFIASVFINENHDDHLLPSNWTLELENSPEFRIEHAYTLTYSLFIHTVLDRETRSQYKVQLKAKNTNNQTFKKSFNLYLIDINDNAPQFSQLNVSIVDLVVGTLTKDSPIIKLNATDPDENENSQLVFSLDNYNDLFNIHPKTGLITSKTSLKMAVRYDLIARVTDRGIPPLSSTMTLTLNLIEDRWTFYRIYRAQIILAISLSVLLIIILLLICAVLNKIFHRWAINNRLKMSFIPFTSDFSSVDKSLIRDDNQNLSSEKTEFYCCHSSTTFPMVSPLLHLDNFYDRGEIANIVSKTGGGCYHLKCQHCKAAKQYTVRNFFQSSELNNNRLITLSNSDDGCFCSSDISSENSERRQARDVLIVQNESEHALKNDKVSSLV